MTRTPPTSPIAPGARFQFIDACMSCKYLLEGLPDQGYCPECGQWFDKFAGVWREGGLLVMQKGVTLPKRCVKCDSTESVKMKKRKMSWHHPAFFLLIFAGLLIYVIVALIIRKTATVHVGLCAKHRRRRALLILATWLAVLGSFVLMIAGVGNDMPELALAALVVFLGALVIWVIKGTLVAPKRIDDRFVWIRGACSDYLSHFQRAQSTNQPPAYR